MIIAIVFIGLHWGFNIKSIVRPGAVHKWRHHWGGVEHSDCDILIMIILSNCSEEANAFYAMFGCLVLTRIIEYPSTDLFSCWTQLVVWIGFIPHLVRATFKEVQVCVSRLPPRWAAGGQQENIDSQRPSYSRRLHRALSCRVGTKTRKYRQSDTGVDGPGTYNHSGRFLCSFRGEQNTFIYMFSEICVLYAYEVCSMCEYKKIKGLERDWEVRPLIKHCLKIT